MKKLFLALLVSCAMVTYGQNLDINQGNSVNFNSENVIKYRQSQELNLLLTKALFLDSLRKEPKNIIPDWKKLEKLFSKKYNDTVVKRAILSTKLTFYQKRIFQDWNRVAEAWLEDTEHFKNVEQMKDRMALHARINNTLYGTILKNVSDRDLLLRAAVIAKKVVDNPNSYANSYTPEQVCEHKANLLDTYANLLYKAGQKEEAIKWQTKVIELTHGKNEEFQTNLKKMKEGRKTW